MALYLLNISVDSPDASSREKENLSFNDQESIVELVLEKFLGFENSIPEQDDTDSNEQTLAKKNISLDYFILPKFPLSEKPIVTDSKKSDSIWKAENPRLLFYPKNEQPPEV